MRYVWLALATSVALNLFFVAKSTSGGRHRPKLGKAALPPTSTSTPELSAQRRNNAADIENCRRELTSCREAATELLVGVFASSGRPSAELPVSPSGPRTTARIADQEMTPEVQVDALDQVAREQLREQWMEARAELLEVFRSELGDPDRMASTTQRDVDSYGEAMGLSESDLERFRQAYAPERRAILNATYPRLASETPEYRALVDSLKSLFALEDRIATEMFGESARRALRASQLERRTTLLAISATYADLPWADPIVW